jgi:hypothetical protein
VVVGKFHDVIEILPGPADVENVNETVVSARNRLERGHALKLALEGAFAFEGDPVDDFNRAPGTGKGAGHPNLAIGAATDDAENLMIRNEWDLRRNGRFRRALAQRIIDGEILHKSVPIGNHQPSAGNPRFQAPNPREYPRTNHQAAAADGNTLRLED